jgi:hypothetical protein
MQNLEALIRENERVIPPNVYGPDGITGAQWGDYLWYFKDRKTGYQSAYPFTMAIPGQKGCGKGRFHSEDALPSQYLILLQIYFLDEVIHSNISDKERKQRILGARAAATASLPSGSLNDLTPDQWVLTLRKSLGFWEYCKKVRLISGNSKPKLGSNRDRSGSLAFVKKASKSAETSTILAIGHIFNEVFKDVETDGRIKDGGKVDFVDALSISMAVIGLASPSRLQAEYPLLQLQKLQVHRPKNGLPIHYLHWPGSKGYSDNNSHIFSVLAPHVEKIVNFFARELEPDRRYVKYLKKPSISWSELLEGFDIDKKRKLNLNFKKKPNLYSVAYALGFYPVDMTVEVIRDPKLLSVRNEGGGRYKIVYLRDEVDTTKFSTDRIANSKIKISYFYYSKHIAQLDLSESILTLGCSRKSSPLSAICGFEPQNRRRFLDRHQLDIIETTAKVAEVIVADLKKSIPKFPESGADSGHYKLVDLEFSLFCCRELRLEVVATRQCPNFSIAPLHRISSSALNPLIDGTPLPVSGRTYKTRNIFEAHGFPRFHLKPHSLRHFSNTLLEQSEIPLEVIAAFSGRKSVKQTLEYVHTSEEDKSERLISILELNEEKNVRIVSRDDLENIGGYPASITETGVCIQELNVTPCDYLNDFLSGCFGCQSSCYTCGDEKAIDLLEKDVLFQNKRIDVLKAENKHTFSNAARDWLVRHTRSVASMEQLIYVLKTFDSGRLVRLSSDQSTAYITNTKTGELQEYKVALPADKDIVESLMSSGEPKSSIPKGMLEIIESIRVD